MLSLPLRCFCGNQCYIATDRPITEFDLAAFICSLSPQFTCLHVQRLSEEFLLIRLSVVTDPEGPVTDSWSGCHQDFLWKKNQKTLKRPRFILLPCKGLYSLRSNQTVHHWGFPCLEKQPYERLEYLRYSRESVQASIWALGHAWWSCWAAEQHGLQV